jgi:DNA-binding transcriptional ArsR family regulator
MAGSDVAVFKALADHTRRQILHDLKGGELSAGQIAARFPISAPSVSRHLLVLKNAGLVSERRDGNRIFYQLQAGKLLTTVDDFLSAVCPAQLLGRRRRAARVG